MTLMQKLIRDVSVRLSSVTRWFAVGLNLKRWLLVGLMGMISLSVGIAVFIAQYLGSDVLTSTGHWTEAVAAILMGVGCLFVALIGWSNTIIAPYRHLREDNLAQAIYSHSKRKKGLKIVAIGGGTGMPSVLRAMKPYTGHITAIVTMADDGGSSGRLRRDLGVQPPGDLRNNIAALADDESLMTRLFQYRFKQGDLEGHAFGNLFIAALSGVAGGLDYALVEIERVLNIQGRVLPATLQDVNLAADIRHPNKQHTVYVEGESNITEFGGQIERIYLLPDDVEAYPDTIQAILDADMVVIGPGSLYTSIMPNLLVKGIQSALHATRAYKVYVCNVATQPGETEDYTVADHVKALEQVIGRGVIHTVLANSAQPILNAGRNTKYVQPVPEHHEIMQRYEVIYADLTDPERPWRHDPLKLAMLLTTIREPEHDTRPSAALTKTSTQPIMTVKSEDIQPNPETEQTPA